MLVNVINTMSSLRVSSCHDVSKLISMSCTDDCDTGDVNQTENKVSSRMADDRISASVTTS